MKRYLFLIAWMDGSDGACGAHTGIHSQNDLHPQYEADNEDVTGWEIEADNPEVAYDKGYRKAFFENFTAQDTFTVVIDLETGEEV